MRISSGIVFSALILLADSGQTVPFPAGYRTWAVTHGEYVVVLRSGVRLQSGRSYHEKLKALASNPF